MKLSFEINKANMNGELYNIKQQILDCDQTLDQIKDKDFTLVAQAELNLLRAILEIKSIKLIHNQ